MIIKKENMWLVLQMSSYKHVDIVVVSYIIQCTQELKTQMNVHVR